MDAALATIPGEVFDQREFPLNRTGKAVRARFTLLMAEALTLDAEKARYIAAAAELTHTASLLHDDCIDSASTRRGLPSLNKRMGVNSAILVGDLVVSLAFDLAARPSPELGPELVRAVRRMTESALLEENSRGRRLTAAETEKITAGKTGALFRWCALSACSLAGKPELLQSCARVGEEAGIAFQIIDDVLDLEGDPADCGKDLLQDVRRGNFTLPLILALDDPKAGPSAAGLLEALRTSPAADLAPALALAAFLGKEGFTAAARRAAAERIKALSPLIDGLPRAEGAAALKDFLFAFAARSA